MSRVNLQYSNVSKGRHGKVFQFLDLCACLPISSPSHLSEVSSTSCYPETEVKNHSYYVILKALVVTDTIIGIFHIMKLHYLRSHVWD